MLKNFLYLSFICLFLSCGNKQASQSCDNFQELNDSSAVDPAWDHVAKGLNCSFGSVDSRYAKNQLPTLEAASEWKGTGWKGERLSAQVVLWTVEEVEQVSCSFSDFKSGDQQLPASVAKANFVRYVMTDVFGKGCGKRKPGDYPASLSADMLDNLACFNIPARTVRPVWVSLDIPADAQAGVYEGSLTILAEGKKKSELKIEFEVLDKVLPPPSQWAFHLDLWQHPTAVARWHNVPVWSDEHYSYLKPMMKMLADAGQKVITTNLNKDPWNGQCEDRYANMIEWTKKADGSWQYDYTQFDRWVSFMMDLGVNKMINCYSMVPWNNELDYLDEATGDTVTVQAEPGKPIFVEMWTPFLKDFTQHLKEKGWLNITNIAMDERSPEMMKATIDVLQKEAPELGISLADNHKSYKQFTFIKDLCISYGATMEDADLQYRKEKGLNTTFYVCCDHPFPNVFTFSQPAEAVYGAWHAAAYGLDGYLRWAYNSWVIDPLTDSRFRTWPAGDTYIAYPEARSSIRFERLREGIQDAEKVRVLRENFQAAGDTEKVAQLDAILAPFKTKEFASPETCAAGVNAAKKALNELSR